MPSECDNCHVAAALRLHASIFEHSGEAILVTDAANRIVAANPELTRLTGYTTEELLGRDPKILSSGETPPETYRAMWDALRKQGRWQGELRDRRKDGGVYPKWVRITALQDAGGAGYIASFTDISKRKSDEARLSHLAFNDSLTGLLNRHGLKIQLDRAMTPVGATLAAPLAILLLGLDHLKDINKTLGHAVGDQLLVGVAERLSACVPDTAILATLGGGEFVIVLPMLTVPQDIAAARTLADEIFGALGNFQMIDGRMVQADACIGIAVFPADGADAATLLQHAAAAMYAAKENTHANIQFFDAAMNLHALARLELETDLRGALEAGQLELHYQPQVTAGDGRIRGFEALLRWRHPLRDFVSPVDFIPIAEESGLIEPIGAWVLDSACRQLADWRAEGIAGLRMAVNLSARELRSSDLVERVRTVLDRHGIQASQIEIEVTESVAMDDPERGIERLRQLHALGVTLAIDDFGTGYSSLAYLKLLPIHVLKIDRAFVRDVETDANDAAICAATIALAHTLGLKVVAEGIETEAQRHVLATVQGCDYLQGYFFGRPAPAASWRERLLDTKSPAAGISSTPFSTDKDAT
ncbi:MAG: putative bifunctional diguanylate cyclase/phosphodiesterase [Rhodocyclaceae bacterium]